MHLTHLPQALLLFLTLTQTILARPEPRSDQIPLNLNQQQAALDPRSPEARQQRLDAWLAQKPMHTTALLAGAAATAVPNFNLRAGRRRDLSSVTGEKGMWIPIEFWDEGDEVGKERGPRGGDVRGEKALEVEVEVDEDVGMEMEMVMDGVKDMAGWVWRKLEKIGLVVQSKRQDMDDMDEIKEPDNGYDGDL